jgi:hypothetical protein
MSNALEEEFFRVEGRALGSRACEYVIALEKAPDGDRITAEERAALWYIAYWSMDGESRPAVSALSMHIDRGIRETRKILSSLIDKGILRSMMDPQDWRNNDTHVYQFVALYGSTAG